MSKPNLEAMQHIRVQVGGSVNKYPAQILDKNDHTINLRVSDALLAVGEPDRITLLVGETGYYMQCETYVKAIYESWWFVHRPPDAAFTFTQRRRFVRIRYQADAVLIPVDERGLPKAVPQTMKLSNLSAEGCQCESRSVEFCEGDSVMAILSLPGLPVLSIQSEIKRVQYQVDKGAAYGIHFSSVTWDQRETLARFITEEIRNKVRNGIDITAV